jgi:hypothetical protein
MGMRWGVAGLLGVALAWGLGGTARAQQPGGDPLRPVVTPGWTFNVAPYLWTPQIDSTVNYRIPSIAATMPTTVSVSPDDYLRKLHFAGMIAGEARYQRFSVLTDFQYYTFNSSSFDTRVTSIDIRGRPRLPLSSSASAGSQTKLDTTVWTLAGGYVLADGEWGFVEGIAGVRYLNVSTTTNYNLGVTVTGPFGGSNTFGGSGAIGASGTVWNGIGGVRGRFKFSGSNWYVPYYFDIGAGGSDLTWQISAGVGYQKGPVGISLLYRYLSFQQPKGEEIRELTMGGPMAMLNFSF